MCHLRRKIRKWNIFTYTDQNSGHELYFVTEGSIPALSKKSHIWSGMVGGGVIAFFTHFSEILNGEGET